MKIKFSLMDKSYAGWSVDPSPAFKDLPKWFTETSSYAPVNSEVEKISPTIKRCVPFLDSLCAGYLIKLNCDIFIDPKLEKSKRIVNYKVSSQIVDIHDRGQVGNFVIPNEYHEEMLKWMNPYHIRTPRGYSVIFSHPFNRTDLPFFTLSGIVDSDSYDVPVNFPFLLKKDFSGIIPKGTPVAQAFPFKREDWKMEVAEPEMDMSSGINKYQSYFVNAYRKLDWKKKSFK